MDYNRVSNKELEMESKLFYWEDWDIIDDFIYQFYDIELKVDIGKFKKLSRFDIAVINFAKMCLILHKGDEEYKFSIDFSIKEYTEKEEE